MRHPAPTWITAAAALLSAGCGLDARLQTRTVCYTVTDAFMPGASGSGSVDTDLGFDLGSTLPILTQPGVSYGLTLQDVELTPGKGSAVRDLGGLDELDLSVLPPDGSTLPETELVRYLRGADPHPASVRAAAERQVDLRPYLLDGQLGFRVRATGALPQDPWTVDATACFLLDVNVRYGRSL